MPSGCPGRDFRNVKVELCKCPQCHYELEIFSIEKKVKCPQCGEMVYREKLPQCADWCAAARDCMGEER